MHNTLLTRCVCACVHIYVAYSVLFSHYIRIGLLCVYVYGTHTMGEMEKMRQPIGTETIQCGVNETETFVRVISKQQPICCDDGFKLLLIIFLFILSFSKKFNSVFGFDLLRKNPFYSIIFW